MPVSSKIRACRRPDLGRPRSRGGLSRGAREPLGTTRLGASGPGFEVADGLCGWWSCCLVGAVGVEDFDGASAVHVVAVVAAAGVVADQPCVGFCLELTDRGEVTAMKRWSPALLEHGALESFAHGVVVRGPGRDPHVTQTGLGQVLAEQQCLVFGSVVGEHTPTGMPRRRQVLRTWSMKRIVSAVVTGPMINFTIAHLVQVSIAVS